MTNELSHWFTTRYQELKAQVNELRAERDQLRAERDRLRAMVDALRPRPVDRQSPDPQCEYMVYTPNLGVTAAFLDVHVPYKRKRPVRQWVQGDWLISDQPTHFYPIPEPPGAWWELDDARDE